MIGAVISGVVAMIALLIWGWWYVLWILLAAILLTIIGEALRVAEDPSLEEGSDRP